MRRWMLTAVLLLTGCGVGGVSSTSTPDPVNVTQTAIADCRSAAVAYQDEIRPIAGEWQDAVKLADQTPRMQLAEQISSLQEIKRDADAIMAPTCATTAHAHLITSMEATINGFLGFMSQESEATIAVYFRTATSEMKFYQADLENAVSLTPKTPTPAPDPAILDALTGTWERHNGVVQIFTEDGLTYIRQQQLFGCWRVNGDQLHLFQTDQVKMLGNLDDDGITYTFTLQGDYLILDEPTRTITFTRQSDDSSLPTLGQAKLADEPRTCVLP